MTIMQDVDIKRRMTLPEACLVRDAIKNNKGINDKFPGLLVTVTEGGDDVAFVRIRSYVGSESEIKPLAWEIAKDTLKRDVGPLEMSASIFKQPPAPGKYPG